MRNVSEDTCKELIKRRTVAKKFCAGDKLVTTHCKVLCYDLIDSGAELFGDDLASYQNSSISCNDCFGAQKWAGQR